jgi:general secretion pathway protein L
MNILAIDIGSYSVKFIELNVERKKTICTKFTEILLNLPHIQFSHSENKLEKKEETNSNIKEENNNEEVNIEEAKEKNKLENKKEIKDKAENSLWLDKVSEIIKNYLNQFPNKGRIIFQYPGVNLTHRFLSLPVANRKKAELMLPFQLEKNLLFPLSEAHVSSQFLVEKNSTYCMSAIASLNHFDEFYQLFEKKNLIPDILTTEISVIQSYAYAKKYVGAYAIIDMGHRSTKGYFIFHDKILSFHRSFLGGEVLDEILSETYQMDLQEVDLYKKEKAFILTTEELELVSDEQKDFSNLIQGAINPLLSDIKKWILGLRVNYGLNISQIYLIGGFSNLKNLPQFFTEYFHVPVEHLNYYPSQPAPILKLTAEENSKYALSYLMGNSISQKFSSQNLLSGRYATHDYGDIPLHSATFIGWRVIVILILLGTGLLFERWMLKKEEKIQDEKITQLLKNPLLEFNRKEQRDFNSNPMSTFNKLQTQKKSINKLTKFFINFSSQKSPHEMNVLASESKTSLNVLDILVKFHETLQILPPTSMISFVSSNNHIQTKFSALTPEELNPIRLEITKLPFKNIKISEENTDQNNVLILDFNI